VRLAALALFAVGCAALTGCTALPERVPLVPEYALAPAERGELAARASPIEAELRAGESAHWLLDRNDLAFTARLALADEAEATLDVQYFIWQDDASGQLLAGRLLAAADRGVKVRLLIDDFSVSTARGEILQLDAHPRVEVRTFNPWRTRDSRLGTALEFLLRPRVLNRRMHNKTYVADGRFAIVGGRNIGDRYFGIHAPFVQDDLDVLVAGPVVAAVTATFDEYWNSDYTYPATLFRRDPRPRQPIDVTRVEIGTVVAREAERLQAFSLQPTDWTEYLAALAGSFAAAKAEIYYDSPEILDFDRPRLYERFKGLVASAEREVLISSPYFIPDREFRDILRDLVARGVRVAVVTNSLATNNHVVAHTGYRRWRRAVLASGVELYELRADAEALALYVTPPAAPAALGLHTKAVVVDRQRVFIGSPNVDPRSMVLNTEIGVASDGAELAARLAALVLRDMAPANAWRVTMDDDGWLRWSSGDEELRRQPAKGFRQRATEFLLNVLPLKKQA
jgi:putative cardiolipin synthase